MGVFDDKKEVERLEYAVAVDTVKHNLMGWRDTDFLKAHLNNRKFEGGWFAKKEVDGIIYFKCCKHGEPPSKFYLKLLKEDGYELAHEIKD